MSPIAACIADVTPNTSISEEVRSQQVVLTVVWSGVDGKKYDSKP
jgi:hypothetical protein